VQQARREVIVEGLGVGCLGHVPTIAPHRPAR